MACSGHGSTSKGPNRHVRVSKKCEGLCNLNGERFSGENFSMSGPWKKGPASHGDFPGETKFLTYSLAPSKQTESLTLEDGLSQFVFYYSDKNR